MGSTAFNPSGAYEIPKFNPSADFQHEPAPVQSDFSAPSDNKEGLYKMNGPNGVVQVPYSKVEAAQQGGLQIDPADKLRYSRDSSSVLGNVGTHLKNLVAVPFHAFTDAPKNEEEQQIKGTSADSGVTANALGQFGLGAARMLVQPTRTALRESAQLRKAGGPQSSLTAASTYDAQGNNVPTAGSKLIDAIPIYGPWSRNYADEKVNKGEAAADAGLLTDVLGPKAIGKGVGLMKPALGRAVLLGKTPEAAYESALKPSTILSPAERDAAVKTGLENSIPISKGGAQQIGDLIDTLNDKIKDTIAADPNRPIDPNSVATRADSARAKFAKQVNAGGDLAAIEASKQQFLQEQGGNPQTGAPAPDMAASDAQAMKQGTYRVLSGKFGEQGSASVESQKALARGLKEEIATQFPEISKLNAAESRLLDLQPILERAVNRISNHQAVGIGTPVVGAAAKAVGSTDLGARAAMVMKAVLDNPNVKSRLAIAVSKANKIPIATATHRVNLYSAALGATAAGSQGNLSGDSSDQPTTLQTSQQ